MKALIALLIASLLTLAFSLSPDSSAKGHHPALRLECVKPHTLLLHRFEDRSARLECGHRVLVRVSVPG